MVEKIISATEAKIGSIILIDGEPFTIRKMDISKTGKHGHAKVRAEAVGVLNDNKKVFVVPGHERFEVPRVNKNKGQVLSIGQNVSIMDLETFETLEVQCSEDIKKELEENSNVEYWEVEGRTIIKRKL